MSKGEIERCEVVGSGVESEADTDELSAEGRIEVLRKLEGNILGYFSALDGAHTTAGRVDPRWLAIARTHIEQGFMCAMRAVGRRGKAPAQD